MMRGLDFVWTRTLCLLVLFWFSEDFLSLWIAMCWMRGADCCSFCFWFSWFLFVFVCVLELFKINTNINERKICSCVLCVQKTEILKMDSMIFCCHPVDLQKHCKQTEVRSGVRSSGSRVCVLLGHSNNPNANPVVLDHAYSKYSKSIKISAQTAVLYLCMFLFLTGKWAESVLQLAGQWTLVSVSSV